MLWLKPEYSAICLATASTRKNRIYDAEVQKRNTGGLAKRSRFYQALIDSTLLPPGEGMNFHPLPESFLIMITPFDLWGRGRYRYTFKMRCEEEPDLYLNTLE